LDLFMPLPVSGVISLNQVNTELGRPATQAINLNDAAVRALAVRPSGVISMSNLHGKSLGAGTLVASVSLTAAAWVSGTYTYYGFQSGTAGAVSPTTLGGDLISGLCIYGDASTVPNAFGFQMYLTPLNQINTLTPVIRVSIGGLLLTVLYTLYWDAKFNMAILDVVLTAAQFNTIAAAINGRVTQVYLYR
jgi:hypothetical protein